VERGPDAVFPSQRQGGGIVRRWIRKAVRDILIIVLELFQGFFPVIFPPQGVFPIREGYGYRHRVLTVKYVGATANRTDRTWGPIQDNLVWFGATALNYRLHVVSVVFMDFFYTVVKVIGDTALVNVGGHLLDEQRDQWVWHRWSLQTGFPSVRFRLIPAG
jgi:hypothetical protein